MKKIKSNKAFYLVFILSLTAALTSHAGAMKNLLIDAEEAIQSHISAVYGDEVEDFINPQLGYDTDGPIVTTVARAYGHSYKCTVRFIEQSSKNFEVKTVVCK